MIGGRVVGWVDRLGEWSVERQYRNWRVMVRGDHRRVRRWMVLNLVRTLAVLAFLTSWHGNDWPIPWWLDVPAYVYVCGFLGWTALNLNVKPAGAYRSGYLEGRRDLLMGMDEARRRGMSHQEWLDAERERIERSFDGGH